MLSRFGATFAEALIVVVAIASVLIFGAQRTAAVYRTIGATAGRTNDGAMSAVVSAFADASRAAGQIGKNAGR